MSEVCPPGEVLIRNLRLTTETVWLDIKDCTLGGIAIRADAPDWPAGLQTSALMLFDFVEPPDAALLQQYRIGLAKIGPFVYLGGFVQDSAFALELTLPPVAIRRIGLRLWHLPQPVTLRSVRVTPRAGTFDLPTSEKVWRTGGADEADLVAADLLARQPECGPKCQSLWEGWNTRMDEYHAKSTAGNLGRTDCFHAVEGGAYSHVSAFHTPPALLEIPRDIGEYAASIGDKSRNMVRKASRAGYRYKAVDPGDYIDDIVAIRTSAPVRQGKPIPAYFSERPRQIVSGNGCKYHGDGFYGIFLDDTLVAYTTLYFYGQLAQVNHILGHADHLKDGVMNLLVHEVVDDLIRNKPWVRAINYLYPGSADAVSGLPLFKRSIGFEAKRLVVAHGDDRLAGIVAEKRRERQRALRAAEMERERANAAPVARIGSGDRADVVVKGACAGRHKAIAALLDIDEVKHAAAGEAHTFDFDAADACCASPALQAFPVVVAGGVNRSNIVQFLGAGLKGFKDSLKKGTFLIFDFPTNIGSPLQAVAVAAGSESEASAESILWKSTVDYFNRRFKSANPDVEALRNGFKGSDFVLHGVAEYPYRRTGFGRVILLKKFR